MQQPALRRSLLPAVFLAFGCTTIAGINEDYSQVLGDGGAGGAGASGRSGSGSGGELAGGSNTGGVSSGGGSSGGAQGGAGAEDGALGAGGAAGEVGAAGGGAGGAGGTGGSDGGAGAAGQGGAIDCPTGLPGPELVRVPSPDGIDYCIDSTEVTNKQYAAFVAVLPGSFFPNQPPECLANAYIPNLPAWPPPSNRDDDPIAGIDWCDANAFCQWAEKRLCGKIGGGGNAISMSASAQNSQWFNACSMSGSRDYPYGSSFSQSKCNGVGVVNVVLGVKTTTGCVGGYAGLYDMSGNVAEWEDSCEGGLPASCNVRGGSFQSSEANLDCARALARGRTSNSPEVGFRCCRDLK